MGIHVVMLTCPEMAWISDCCLLLVACWWLVAGREAEARQNEINHEYKVDVHLFPGTFVYVEKDSKKGTACYEEGEINPVQ
jgi:hypothetical protein